MNKNKKVFGNAHIRNTFCSEVIIRVLANALLLAFHIRTWLLRQKSNLTDLPIGLLALIHLLMLLIVGSITPDLFTSQGRSWDDITCKSLVYLHRVMRGLSVCTTSLLSVLQAVTLSPRSSCLAKLKHRSSRHHLCCLLLLWLFYTSVSSHLCISIFAIPNQTSANFMYVTASCTIAPLGYLLRHVLSTLLIFRDSFLMGLMAISGGYMVVLLFRHKRQSQSLHCTKLALRASPEQKATRTILLLLTAAAYSAGVA
ncbi:vomeronasal type-1 receptor 100-like [Ctenodactylus gundi]